MSRQNRGHMGPAGFVFGLVLIIGVIFGVDAIARTLWPATEENIVGIDGFSPVQESAVESATEEEISATEEPTTDPNVDVITLSQADMAEGLLINADLTHPYAGAVAFSDFSSITDAYVVPRDATMPIRAEVQTDLRAMFDAYAAYTGWANLQIYSTLQSTLETGALYTNSLPDRNTGYSFDIGLITSTGEVVAYLQKHNEWMVANSWQYGFILRYPSDKTAITGIDYAPHHFRYVGRMHAQIMHENNFCLEEYLAFLRGYTMDTAGYAYAYEGQAYTLYYVPADASGTTNITIPKGAAYTVSGDNQGGFVLTIAAQPSAEESATESMSTAPTT